MTRSLILAALALGLLATAVEARSRHAFDNDDFGLDPSIIMGFNPRPIGPTFQYYAPLPQAPVVCQTVPVNRFWPEYGTTTTCR